MASSTLVPLLVALAGSGGLAGVVIALVKLRGDRDSAAVSQAHGANEALAATLNAVERERDYWKNRYHETAELLARIDQRGP